jgi:hypothetical protein
MSRQILRPVKVAAATLGFLFLTAAAAQEPTATATHTLTPATVAEPERECRNLPRPGSRIADHVCRTAAEWADAERLARTATARARNQIPLMQAYPHGFGGGPGAVTPPSVVMNR